MADHHSNTSYLNHNSTSLIDSTDQTINQQQQLEAALLVGSVHTLPCFKDLIAVLFECFSIISLGYLSCRFKLISPGSKDLGSYLTTFALPTIIFLNIAQMEFQTINVSFLLCMLGAKLLLFISVSLLTLAISYPTNFGYAGSLSILATQSNDFALGYPLIKSLYGETKPEMLNYLSLMAPIQLLILNPLGIIMLEYHKSTSERAKTGPEAKIASTESSGSVCKFCEVNQIDQQMRRQSCLDERTRSANTEQNLPPAYGTVRTVVQIDQQSTGARNRRNQRGLALAMPARGTSTPITQQQGVDSDLNHYETINVVQESFDSVEKNSIDYGLGSLPQNNKNIILSSSSSSHDVDKITSERHLSISCSPVINDNPTILVCTCKPPDAMSHGVTVSEQNKHIINWNFIRAIAFNPLIVASIVALLVNLIHGPELPKVVTKTANTIAASFAAPALFVVGLSMYGKFELLLRNPNDLLLASILVLVKELILPNTLRTLALMVLPKHVSPEELPFLIDFAYLYGVLPTAPTACIIANQYGILSNVVSISMLLSTFTSAPLMLSASAIISQPPAMDSVESVIAQTVKVSSLLSMTLTALTLYVIWRYKKNISYVNFINVTDKLRRNPAHIFLPLLAITQTVIAIGGIFWFFVDAGKFEPATIPSEIHISAHHHPMSNLALGEEHNRSILVNDHDLVEPMIVPVYADLKLWTVCTVHYIFASSGLLMARFVMLCVVVTMFARTFRSHAVAVRVSRYMITMYALVGTGIIIWLIFDSNNLRCTPAEASLPSQLRFLVVRLVFNLIFIALAVPMFAMVFKSNNRSRLLRKAAANSTTTAEIQQQQRQKDTTDETSNVSEVEINESLRRQSQFVTSCVSLTSETSSALTANTNIDASSSNNNNIRVQQQPPKRGSTNIESIATTHNQQQLIVDQFSNLIDADKSNQRTLPGSSTRISSLTAGESEVAFDETNARSINNCKSSNTFEPLEVPTNHQRLLGHTGPQMECIIDEHSAYRIGQTCDLQSERSSATAVEGILIRRPQFTGQFPLSEFHKYSILIVFMLIDSALNVTSISQVLSQDKPYGTFIQIEVMNVAFDFGQGLLTFLICVVQELFFRKY